MPKGLVVVLADEVVHGGEDEFDLVLDDLVLGLFVIVGLVVFQRLEELVVEHGVAFVDSELIGVHLGVVGDGKGVLFVIGFVVLVVIGAYIGGLLVLLVEPL